MQRRNTYLLCTLTLSSGFSNRVDTSFLFLLSLWTVLVHELEELSSSVLVQCMRKLSDSRRNLQALTKDNLLALKANVLWPLHKTGEVGFMLEVWTC